MGDLVNEDKGRVEIRRAGDSLSVVVEQRWVTLLIDVGGRRSVLVVWELLMLLVEMGRS